MYTLIKFLYLKISFLLCIKTPKVCGYVRSFDYLKYGSRTIVENKKNPAAYFFLGIMVKEFLKFDDIKIKKGKLRSSKGAINTDNQTI